MKRRGAPPLYPLPLSSIIAGLDLGSVRLVRVCGWFFPQPLLSKPFSNGFLTLSLGPHPPLSRCSSCICGKMFFPMGKPTLPGMFHTLEGSYGANKTCKQRGHPGSQGWHKGSCASVGFSKMIKGTLGAPEYVKRGQQSVNFYV